ncbi:uncharacterized protein LOC116999023 isoform X7 [Catharus ustulatus]|uniref:uncharacterized protein LOC116999023 isoform X7 n=1 Tax=Catharus ustulatus TaxID=91951 RepID=UPI00140C5E2F|nr:uncharacterized protein LOC116999023 isoform X7 [Catharus ustulatus]
MMAQALERWIREEMELPPSAIPSQAVLRRLCAGPTAPIWDFVTRHVRSERNVKKIRGNLRWYGHLQEMEAAAAGPPSRQGALRAEVEQLRKELQLLEDAIEGAQEEAWRLGVNQGPVQGQGGGAAEAPPTQGNPGGGAGLAGAGSGCTGQAQPRGCALGLGGAGQSQHQAPPTLRSHIQLRLQQHLRFLSAATRGRRAALRPLQEQVVGVARAGLGSAPPQLEGEGRHRRGLVLGALGEPLPNPGALPPLWETGRGLGGPQGALLSRAAILKQQLRQGALSVHRRRGLRGLGVGPGPEVPPLTPPPELTTQLRLVSTSCQERIRAWPRLLDLLDQWWTLPAQWTLATPRGHAPFSHWLQRWQSAALTLQATPTLEEGEGQGKKAPPPEGL